MSDVSTDPNQLKFWRELHDGYVQTGSGHKVICAQFKKALDEIDRLNGLLDRIKTYAPADLTALPAGGMFTLKRDTRVDGEDLRRFVDTGGTIDYAGYRLFIDGAVSRLVEKTSQGQTVTTFGSNLSVPPGTKIV